MLDTIEMYLAVSDKGPCFDYFTQCVRHRLHQVSAQMKKKISSETETKTQDYRCKELWKRRNSYNLPNYFKAKVKVSRNDVHYVHLYKLDVF